MSKRFAQVETADLLADFSVDFRRPRLPCSDRTGLQKATQPAWLLVHAPRAPQVGRPRKGSLTAISTELAGRLAWPGTLMGSATMTAVGIATGRGAGAIIERFSPIDSPQRSSSSRPAALS